MQMMNTKQEGDMVWKGVGRNVALRKKITNTLTNGMISNSVGGEFVNSLRRKYGPMSVTSFMMHRVG